ncbi:hypothetical protein [Endozoicomonas arenosclerae]|uniref:hypothetical protein n=1 Tax=Endozoicomonas arenosclerae TaxID=1633495 RepID=UPI0007831419|nr:hypothetical protein [Endozoicomonas arenosclerae]
MLEGTGEKSATPPIQHPLPAGQVVPPVAGVEVDPSIPKPSPSDEVEPVKRKVEVVVSEEPTMQEGLTVSPRDLLSKFPKMIAVESEDLRKDLILLTLKVKRKQFKDGLVESREMLKKVLKEYPENIALIKYLGSMLLMCQLNGDSDIENLEKILSEKNREERILWHLALAEAAAKGSEWIQPCKKKELYCYRHAADHGSSVAKQKLIREVLFSETPTTSPFMDCEALRMIHQLSREEEGALPEPDDDRDKAILDLVRLVRGGRYIELTAARELLEKQLLKSHDDKLIRLAPWLYVEEAFGPVEPLKVQELNGRINKWQKKLRTSEDKKYFASFSSYWEALLLMKTGDRRESIKKLRLLMDSGELSKQHSQKTG